MSQEFKAILVKIDESNPKSKKGYVVCVEFLDQQRVYFKEWMPSEDTVPAHSSYSAFDFIQRERLDIIKAEDMLVIRESLKAKHD